MTRKAKRAQYTLEFKLEAVRLVKAGQSMAAVAASNIHCGTSSKPAVSNGSRAQRSTDSAFFLSIVVKIHTVCPYHGCQR